MLINSMLITIQLALSYLYQEQNNPILVITPRVRCSRELTRQATRSRVSLREVRHNTLANAIVGK